MFKNAVTRLTVWYLVMIITLSVGFTIALYKVSVRELDANQAELETLLNRGDIIIGRAPAGIEEFTKTRIQQIEDSRQHIRLQLLYFNIIIITAGAAASYFLARRTLQPIEESVEAQARFTSDASHELRTPLTSMKSEIEVALRDKKLTLQESKNLHVSVLEEIDRLEALSNGLLKLARQDTSPSAFTECSLTAIIEEAIKNNTSRAAERAITLNTDLQDATIMCDQWGLVELANILLDNAIKYSPDNSKITISTFVRYHRNQVGISIKDEGTGIAASDLPHIFDRFYRADRSRTKNATSGYGLGLSIAKKIIDLHHGVVEVKSALGHGSTFTILLPVNQSPWSKLTLR